MVEGRGWNVHKYRFLSDHSVIFQWKVGPSMWFTSNERTFLASAVMRGTVHNTGDKKKFKFSRCDGFQFCFVSSGLKMAFFYYQLYNKLHVLEQTGVVWPVLCVKSNPIYKQTIISHCMLCITVTFKWSFNDMFIFDFKRHFSCNGYMSFTRTTSLFLRPAKLGQNKQAQILCGSSTPPPPPPTPPNPVAYTNPPIN